MNTELELILNTKKIYFLKIKFFKFKKKIFKLFLPLVSTPSRKKQREEFRTKTSGIFNLKQYVTIYECSAKVREQSTKL